MRVIIGWEESKESRIWRFGSAPWWEPDVINQSLPLLVVVTKQGNCVTKVACLLYAASDLLTEIFLYLCTSSAESAA